MFSNKSDESSQVSLRSTLEDLINNASVKAIIIGENHYTSAIEPALTANIDLFLKSPRNVIFITENYNQRINPMINKATKKMNDNHPLAKISEFDETNLSSFALYRMLISHGLKVYGAENKISNPFDSEKELSREEMRKQEIYGSSIDRVVIANQVFSDLINENRNDNTIVIFFGGAGHSVEAVKDGELKDAGIKGRIEGAQAIYLSISETDKILAPYAYENPDNQLQGTFDYYIEASEVSLYEKAFAAQETIEDKKALLEMYLNNLIKSYLERNTNPADLFMNKFLLIVNAFKDSLEAKVKEKIELPSLNSLMHSVIDQKNKMSSAKKEKSALGRFFTKKSNVYSTKKLNTAIAEDLSLIQVKTVKNILG